MRQEVRDLWHNLYNHLRTLDTRLQPDSVQELPQDERWAAILDRLQRASGVGLGWTTLNSAPADAGNFPNIAGDGLELDPSRIRSRVNRSCSWWRATARRCSS